MTYELSPPAYPSKPVVRIVCAYCGVEFLTNEPEVDICPSCDKKHNVCTGFPVPEAEAKERLRNISNVLREAPAKRQRRLRSACTGANICYGFVFED